MAALILIDDLAWLDQKLEGFGGDERGFPAMSAFGGKAVVGWSRINVRF
jgi:hypothetical protein